MGCVTVVDRCNYAAITAPVTSAGRLMLDCERCKNTCGVLGGTAGENVDDVIVVGGNRCAWRAVLQRAGVICIK